MSSGQNAARPRASDPANASLGSDRHADEAATLAEEKRWQVMKQKMPSDPQQIEALYTLGYQLYQAGRFDDARSVFLFLIFLDGNQVRFIMAYGKTLQQLGRFGEAVASYAMAHALRPTDAQSLLLAAQCMVAQGDAEDARDLLQDAVEISHAAGDTGLAARAEQLAAVLSQPHSTH